MATYNVGDIVRVKKPIARISGIAFVDSMRKYCNTDVTIAKVYSNANDEQRYRIAEDTGYWVWCDKFFEPIDTSKEPYEYW